ncbi:MAG TPA: hypothetical protein DDZ80_28035 [Cyanobacteria bacterium UBA8803]|nr:hypothetical protein [Cyanobacteria bacterium UBA9273]HBL62114.1 hypothetical protein [Cyanobacteria bacterium UBA8803]
MRLTAIDRVGDWNPQLLRELKGRLKPRNGLIVAFSSLLMQGVILLGFSEQHCTKYASSNASTCVNYYWEFNWLGIFRTLNWILPLGLFALGVYVLIADLVQEQRRGTLNFIRLSPQSSQSILLGKMLGGPILVYLGLGLAIPLHWFAGLVAGVPLAWIIGWYALVGVAGAFLYSTVILNTGLTQAPYQALAGSFLGAWLGSGYIGLIDIHFNWDALTYRGLGNWHWFFWSLGSQPLLLTLWMLVTLSVGTYWMWQAANRLFCNPYGTMLSKQQSYWLVGSFQIWLLGLFWSQLNHNWVDEERLFGCLFGISVLSLGLFLVVIWGISPQRQALLDWARYGEVKQPQAANRAYSSRWLDWVGGAKSPAPVAIAINLAITSVIWLPWLLLFPAGVSVKIQAIAGLVLSANLIWIYALITQVMLLGKRQKPSIWAASYLSSAIFLPPILLAMDTNNLPGLWLVSVFGAPWLLLEKVSAMTVCFSLFGQWAMMIGLSLSLTRQLRCAGESNSKSLFASRSDLGKP